MTDRVTPICEIVGLQICQAYLYQKVGYHLAGRHLHNSSTCAGVYCKRITYLMVISLTTVTSLAKRDHPATP